MLDINVFLNNNILSIVVVLSVLVLVLLIISIMALAETKKLKKRYEQFTGGSRRADGNLETQFGDFYKAAKAMDEKYSAVVNILKDLNGNMEKCVQKVGVVRYNPFDEVGGNLSYAVAILDSKNNGVVLNGIHSRTGSFTYAKPIELGVSEYTLSDEEQEALTKALEESYTPQTDIVSALNELEKELPKVYDETEGKKRGKRRRKKAEVSEEEIQETEEIKETEEENVSEETEADVSEDTEDTSSEEN